MALDERQWFVEIAPEAGMALGLKIRAKLHEEQTPYQKIEIYDTEDFGKLMVIDGCVMLTSRDNFVYHEMMAHPVLLTHPNPEQVVIIGGGDCGTLREVLRHPEVKRARQIDIDERVTRLAEEYFPELCEANGDTRASLEFADGIQAIKDAAPGSLDVVIVDSTDPVGPAEGLFSEPFYRDCLRALGDGGLLVQQSESPLLHMNILRDMHAAMRRAGYADVRSLGFPQTTYPSGWWSATLARKNTSIGEFRADAGAAIARQATYYTPDVHRGALAMPAFFVRELGPQAG